MVAIISLDAKSLLGSVIRTGNVLIHTEQVRHQVGERGDL
jgi:hypothetical protein